MYTTTLKRLRDNNACKSGYDKLANHVGVDFEGDINLRTILDNNDLNDCIWSTRATDNGGELATAFSIYCGHRHYTDPAWVQWAADWMSGKDRSAAAAARAAAAAARAATSAAAAARAATSAAAAARAATSAAAARAATSADVAARAATSADVAARAATSADVAWAAEAAARAARAVARAADVAARAATSAEVAERDWQTTLLREMLS